MDGSAEIHFAQKLASNEKKIRDRAMKRLQKYLSLKSSHGVGLTDEDLLKIWKGLFYCMWMQDKPLIQEELSKRITGLVEAFAKSEDALRFVKIFLTTHAREWNRIDRLRLDKFMLMIRDMLHRTFSLLSRAGWPVSDCRIFSSGLSETVMQAEESRLPDGLRLHLADIYVEELKKVSLAQMSTSKLIILLKPFIEFVITSKKPELVQRVLSCVVSQAISQLSGSCDDTEKAQDATEGDGRADQEEEMDTEGAGHCESDCPSFELNLNTFLAVIFKLAQRSHVRAANRAAVYSLVKQYPDVVLGADNSDQRQVSDEVQKSIQIFLDDGQAKDKLVGGNGDLKKKKKKRKKHFEVTASEAAVISSNIRDVTNTEAEPTPHKDSHEEPVPSKKKKKRKSISSSAADSSNCSESQTAEACEASQTASPHRGSGDSPGPHTPSAQNNKKRKRLSLTGDLSDTSQSPLNKKTKKDNSLGKHRKGTGSNEDNSIDSPVSRPKAKVKKSKKDKSRLNSSTSLNNGNTNSNARSPSGNCIKVETMQLVRYPKESVPHDSGGQNVPRQADNSSSSYLSDCVDAGSVGSTSSVLDSRAKMLSSTSLKHSQERKAAGSPGSSSLFSPDALNTPLALVKQAVAMVAPASDPGPAHNKPSSAPGAPMTPGTKKKVVFDLRRNKANKFKDYLKSLNAVMASPPFEPGKSPSASILKPVNSPLLSSSESDSTLTKGRRKSPFKRRAQSAAAGDSTKKKGRNRSRSPLIGKKAKTKVKQ